MGMGIGLPTPWSILLEYADDADDDNGCDANDENGKLQGIQQKYIPTERIAAEANN